MIDSRRGSRVAVTIDKRQAWMFTWARQTWQRDEDEMKAIPWLMACAFIMMSPLIKVQHAILRAESRSPPRALVEQCRKRWDVPGVAVGVIHKGKVMYLAGHGVRVKDKKDPITPDTLFPIASCTKGFTATALALLVDEGKLHWDDRVGKHVSFFRLADPLVNREVRLRDLLCHRTGLGRHDLLWYRSGWSQKEIIRRVGTLPLEEPFRTAFQYQSTMYNVLGFAVQSASGQSWESFVRQHLFHPLGMKSTVCTTIAAHKYSLAGPHRLDDRGQPQVIPGYAMEQPDAAGSIHGSASDLLRWLRFHLEQGVVGKQRLVSWKHLRETHTPQMVLPRGEMERALFPDTNLMSYAMGWVVLDYRGKRMLAHTGVIDGYRVRLTMLPGEQLGVVVLSNLHATRMNLALTHTLIDHFLHLPARDWDRTCKRALRQQRMLAARDQRASLAQRVPGTRPNCALSALAGKYHNAAYGTMQVTLERGELMWQWRRWHGKLQHFHYNTFVLPLEMLGTPEIVFQVNEKGKVIGMKVAGKLGVEFRHTEDPRRE